MGNTERQLLINNNKKMNYKQIAVLVATAIACDPVIAFTSKHQFHPPNSASLLKATTTGSVSATTDAPVLDDLIISKTNEHNDDHYEKWELRLYDDADNTREKVARVLVQVTQLPEFDAFKIMTHAHNT